MIDCEYDIYGLLSNADRQLSTALDAAKSLSNSSCYNDGGEYAGCPVGEVLEDGISNLHKAEDCLNSLDISKATAKEKKALKSYKQDCHSLEQDVALYDKKYGY